MEKILVYLFAVLMAVVFTRTAVSSTGVNVSISPDTKYQIFEGFGQGNMHQWTPLWYKKYNSTILGEILDTLYTLKAKGLDLKICRFLMPVSDNPSHH